MILVHKKYLPDILFKAFGISRQDNFVCMNRFNVKWASALKTESYEFCVDYVV